MHLKSFKIESTTNLKYQVLCWNRKLKH